MKRQEIVEEARRFVALKARWGRMGRSEKRMDCGGLIALVRKKFGLPTEEFERYSLYPEDHVAMDAARRHFTQVHPPLKDGMLIVFQQAGHPWHLGISATDQYGRRSIIHCAVNHMRCVEESYQPKLIQHFRAAFEFPGVEED